MDAALEIPTWPEVAKYRGEGPALTISDRDGFNVRYDALGRWRSVTVRGPLYLRSLDGRIVRRQRRRVDAPEAFLLEPASVPAFHEAVRERTLDLLSGRVRLVPIADPTPLEPVLERLELAARWDAARFEEDRIRFRAIHGEVESMPPDRSRALRVLWRDDPLEAAAHLEAVRGFFGPALPLRQGVLLAGVPGPTDLPLRLAALREEFGPDLGIEVSPEALAAFEARDLAAAAAAGLRSIAVRLRSGAPGPDPESLAAGRSAGLRWTILAPGPDPAVVGARAQGPRALVHLPGAERDPPGPHRTVRGPIEEFLYYA